VRGEHLPTLLPGIEVTTYRGHWNAWGTDRWWEFREPVEAEVSRTMQAAAASGALVSVNHPKPFGPAWEYPAGPSVPGVRGLDGALGGLNAVALAFWEERLLTGQRLVAVGGSDTHILRSRDRDPRHADRLGIPTTWVKAGPRADAAPILEALRAGRTFVSASPEGPQLYLDAGGRGVEIEVRDGEGATLVVLADGHQEPQSSVGAEHRIVPLLRATNQLRHRGGSSQIE